MQNALPLCRIGVFEAGGGTGGGHTIHCLNNLLAGK